jgi:hypothetical protein
MQPGDLQDYLDRVAELLGELGGEFVRGPVITVDYSGLMGTLDTQLEFADGTRLTVGLACVGPRDFPAWLDYRIHLMDSDNRCIFRYDNSSNHPETGSFPHHKHVGPEETVVDHPQPSLAHLIAEVRRHLYNEP